MLRTSLQSVRAFGGRPVVAAAARQWPIAATRRASLAGQVSFLYNVTARVSCFHQK